MMSNFPAETATTKSLISLSFDNYTQDHPGNLALCLWIGPSFFSFSYLFMLDFADKVKSWKEIWYV